MDKLMYQFIKAFSLIVFISSQLLAQKINDNYVIRINEVEEEIVIDGELNEITRANAQITQDFEMTLPMDTSHAVARTEVMMAYDENAFYMGAIFYDDRPGGYVVESLKRDFSFGGNDNFLVSIDPFDDQTNGFLFGANAAGSTDLWLKSPRTDVTFSNTIFFTTFLQYNSQAENININSRFQWRFLPAPDFYLVYTENYLPEHIQVKNRELVLKLAYWYNI